MTRIQLITNSLSEILNTGLSSKYYNHSLPSKVDCSLIDLLTKLRKLESYRIQECIQTLNDDQSKILGLFAERMASYSIRKNDIKCIDYALFALILYSQTQDRRELLLILSLVYNSIIKLGFDPKLIFEKWSLLGGDFLIDYLKRSKEDKSIEAMGYVESEDKDGFIYLRTW